MNEAKEKFAGFLSKKNLRVTHQRDLVLDAFLKKEGHFSAEELYDLVRSRERAVGRATVYRTLKLLVESGIARVVDFADGMVRYEHDCGHGHHDRLTCERCRKSIEVAHPSIEELEGRLSQRNHFQVTRHKIDVFGICEECLKKK